MMIITMSKTHSPVVAVSESCGPFEISTFSPSWTVPFSVALVRNLSHYVKICFSTGLGWAPEADRASVEIIQSFGQSNLKP